jgi:ubiquitin-conjugating enzyme E2 D
MWEAIIRGPPDTPYENGQFILHVQIPPNSYPLEPPKITFQTRVFHPNISSKGEICIDILGHNWSPALTLAATFISICVLLSTPNADDFLVPEAAFLLKEHPAEFQRKAKEWTRKYATLAGPISVDGEKELMAYGDRLCVLPATSSPPAFSISEGGRRPARFSIVEPLQPKTFDSGESKECLSIILQCFAQSLSRNRSSDFRQAITDLNLDEELQSLAVALQKAGTDLDQEADIERLMDQLDMMFGMSAKEVVDGCLRMYTMQTFLYPQVNQFLRHTDTSKIHIYGSYVRLLCFCFDHPTSVEVHSIDVYRGMELPLSTLDAYRRASGSGTSFRWASFSSTSRNRRFVENYFQTNTLFIMHLRKIHMYEKKAIDISALSHYPDEEEVLLNAGVEFTVERIDYNEEYRRHEISLNVYV